MANNRDRMEFEGLVTSAVRDVFWVEINNEQRIQCSLAGRIRMNSVRILEGDRVKIEVSIHDSSRGRIVYRFPKDKASVQV